MCIAQSMSKVPKIRSLYILTNFEKNAGDEVYFLPADNNESFQQVDSNIFAVCSWECPKFQNTKFANRCKISNKDEVDFLAGDKH